MVVFFAAIEIGDGPPATATGVVLSGTMGGSTTGPPSVAFLADSFGYRSRLGTRRRPRESPKEVAP